MPERVHTVFDDEHFPKSVAASPTANSTRKRKAAEAFANPLPAQTKIITFQEKVEVAPEGRKGEWKPTSKIKNSLRQRALDLLPTRRRLPIYQHAEEIRNALREQNTLLLVGETGSGKSTQVPHFLYDEAWCKPRKVSVTSPTECNGGTTKASTKSVEVGGCIAITQPRRVAAISLARRVAEEMGTPLGNSSPASTVGYSVRFDNSTSPSTRIKFLTEGMLLQEMLRDPWLKAYSAVVVDEVHERGVNVDLVLGFLKMMNDGKRDGRGGVGMKVVVMSATADMERIEKFFMREGSVNEEKRSGASNGDAHEVNGVLEGADSDPESPWSGFSDTEADPRSKTTQNDTTNTKPFPSPPNTVATCHIKGRQHPVTTIYTPMPLPSWVDAAFNRIVDIHLHQPLPGDILVFLTGQETVETLESLCADYARSLTTSKDPKLKGIPKLLILPLFAALPQAAQQRVFTPTPPHIRKVILATNIAETSITVPGIRFVIDSGKAKRKQFRSRLNLDSLLVKPISKSSANQRKGRAGREAPGTCYRLYTEADYLQLPQDNDPEILRCDLTQVVLCLQARGVSDLSMFPWLTPPRRQSLEVALLQLLHLSALSPDTLAITPLGAEIARLPLPAAHARVLLAAASPQFACLAQAIDIISALSVESVFLNIHTHGIGEEKREEIQTARATLYRRSGDHATLLSAVEAYTAENSDRKSWCVRHAISHRAMQGVMDVRKQLTSLMANSKHGASSSVSAQNLETRILQSFLTGFATHVARLMPDGSYKTLHTNQTIAIHPSSVLFGRKVEGIMYDEFVWTQKGYARNVSAVEMGWVAPAE